MSQSAKTVAIKPSVVAKLFGVPEIVIENLGSKGAIEVKRNAEKSIRVNFSNWRLDKGWFSSRLVLLDEKGKTVINMKVPNASNQAIEPFLFQTIYKEQLQSFCEALALCIDGRSYFSNSTITELSSSFSELIDGVKQYIEAAITLVPISYKENLKLFIEDEEKFRANYNELFIASEASKWSDLFARLEDNPLTTRQVESVVTEEDATLVVAGAGTGKTSSVVGKIGYLLNANIAKPNSILALAFNRDAAKEMRERVEQKTGHKIEIRTFHSYGKFLIENDVKEKLKIADYESFDRAKLAHVNSILEAMYDDGEEANLIINFLSFHRYPAKFREDFKSHKDYLSYMSKLQPVTLKDEWVKSFEEVLIADWLTIHGVKYEYEKPYEIKTSSRFKRQYQPDFYLTDYGIYLEHFGIDKNGKTAPWISSEDYNRSIEWKRSLHKQNGTTLVETYSWERMEGTLSKKLAEKLGAVGVTIRRVSNEELRKQFETKQVGGRLVSLINDFLSVFKEGQWKIEELDAKLAQKDIAESRRLSAFLRIFEAFMRRYDNHLSARGELDFADLIAKATVAIQTGKAKPKFTHIIVDEFQDISRGRSNFLQAIRASSGGAKLMCVGDDWQSIYGFTGSDVHITTKFADSFGFFKRVDLDRTFRFRQPIIDASARFIQMNPAQLKKEIRGRDASDQVEIEVVAGDEHNLENSLNQILRQISEIKPGKTASVLFLGRYNFTKPEFFQNLTKKYKSLEISFLTVHKSKGLQADYVVILGLENAKFGFPGSIATDPIMSLVIPSEEDYEDAEERRVFYVALTRAKEKVYLVKPTNPSKFLVELMAYDEVSAGENLKNVDTSCSECGLGSYVLKFPNRINGYAWRCSYGRYCGGKAKFCPTCKNYPLRNGSCADLDCISPETVPAARKKRRR